MGCKPLCWTAVLRSLLAGQQIKVSGPARRFCALGAILCCLRDCRGVTKASPADFGAKTGKLISQPGVVTFVVSLDLLVFLTAKVLCNCNCNVTIGCYAIIRHNVHESRDSSDTLEGLYRASDLTRRRGEDLKVRPTA